MSLQVKPEPRNSAETKARILDSAQAVFAEKGYPQTGLRDIAARAGVATSLVAKYFETKANLFELALTQSVEVTHLDAERKVHFAELLIRAVSDPSMRIFAPAMIALSLGDEEAREIASRVARERIILPTAEWLGPPDALARAAGILMLSIGFAIFARHVSIEPAKSVQEATAKFMEDALQKLIEAAER
jgi:AcrR family transcriptional regulator